MPLIEIELQAKQEKFFYSEADVAFFGGAAGGGKTFVSVSLPLKYLNVPGFKAVIFRKTAGEITQPGALWDEAANLYSGLNCKANQTDLKYTFPGDVVIKFDHMQHDKDRFKKHGAQYAFVVFDEVVTFSAVQFWYIFSRMRSMTGIATKMRATCNPDADSWVAKLIAWWIGDDGYPILERAGVIRWFVRRGDDIMWFDSKEDAVITYPGSLPKSFTFIPSSIQDNQKLLEKDAGYLANLESLGLVERERLLNGNWKIRPAAGLYFKRNYFEIIPPEDVPDGLTWVRYWDLASSKAKQNVAESGQPCWTAGTLMAIEWADYSARKVKTIYIRHVKRFRETPLIVEKYIKECAERDGNNCHVGVEEDPGQAGKSVSEHYKALLMGYAIHTPRADQNKVVRASPLSAKAEDLCVKLVRGAWNEDFISEAESFPESKFKDQIDSASGAYNLLFELPDYWVS
jgi:predicted phage terminase large subunit-like protein